MSRGARSGSARIASKKLVRGLGGLGEDACERGSGEIINFEGASWGLGIRDSALVFAASKTENRPRKWMEESAKDAWLCTEGL